MKEKYLSRKPSNSFSALLSYLADPTIVINAMGEILAANKATEKYFGISSDELVGKNFADRRFFSRKTAALIKRNLEKILNGHYIDPYEVKLNTKGKTIILEVNAKLIEHNREIIEVIVFRDVTERTKEKKELQKDLHKSELNFKTINDSAFDGIIIFDIKQVIRYWNPAAERIFGYTKDEVQGKTLQETIIPPEALKLIPKIEKEFIKNPETVSRTREFPGLKKDGTQFPTEISLSSVKINGEELVVVTIRDITERKNAEHALQQQRDILEAVTKKAGVGLTLITKDYKIFLANEWMKEKNGRDIVNKTCFSVLHNDRTEVCPDCPVKRIFDGENLAIKEDHRLDSDGNQISAQITAIPVKDKNGQVFAALEVVVPTTQRIVMEKKVKEAEELSHAMFEQTPLGVAIVDPETQAILQFNEIAHRQLGYSREEFSKLRLSDLEANKDLREIQRRIKTALTIGQTEFLTRHRTKTGEIRIVLVNKRAIQLTDRKLLLLTCHDVTGINRMHDAVRTSEEKFYTIANSVRDALVMVDQEGKITFWNLAAEKTFGYTSKEVLGKVIHELVTPESLSKEGKERIKRSIQTFGETGIGYFTVGTVEVKGRCKDGSEFPAELVVSPLKVGRKWHAVGLVKDISNRKLAEQKLSDAEQRYHALFNQSPLGVLVIDPQTLGFVEFNDVAHLQLGYSREEFEKITIPDFQAEETPKQIRAHINQLGGDGGGEFETKHRTKTGEIRNVLVTIRAFQSEGKPYLHCICHDITEAKRIQTALIESEKRFRAISNSAMDAIILCGSNDKVLYWNPAAQKMFGYSAGKALGKKLMDLVIPPNFHRNHLKFLSQLALTNTARRHFDLTALKRDGTTFPIDLSVSSVKLNNQLCFLSVVRDITEWKAMEEALRQERDMLESVAKSTDMVLSIIGKDYRIIWANEKALKATDCANLENRYCYETFGRGSPGVCEGCGVKKVFENGESVVKRDYFVKIHGKDFWSELVSTPIKDKEGHVIAAVEIAIDITERKQLQNKLADYSQRLEEIVQKRTDELKKTQAELVKSERLAAIGELAGMIGHDLRNPLTGIKNSAYIMKKKGQALPPEQTKEMLEIIDKCVNYSNKIINDLLDYSREIALSKGDESPKILLKESLSMLNIPENITIKNKLKDTAIINVDRDKIKRVFINLVKNAVDAMPQGGEITIESRELKYAIEISFADTGPGINEDILPRLFMPLFTTKAQGMGFGLAICKRIIEAHRGTISVKTEKGHGTTFTLTFPIESKIESGGENIWINIPESSLSTMTRP